MSNGTELLLWLIAAPTVVGVVLIAVDHRITSRARAKLDRDRQVKAIRAAAGAPSRRSTG